MPIAFFVFLPNRHEPSSVPPKTKRRKLKIFLPWVWAMNLASHHSFANNQPYHTRKTRYQSAIVFSLRQILTLYALSVRASQFAITGTHRNQSTRPPKHKVLSNLLGPPPRGYRIRARVCLFFFCSLVRLGCMKRGAQRRRTGCWPASKCTHARHACYTNARRRKIELITDHDRDDLFQYSSSPSLFISPEGGYNSAPLPSNYTLHTRRAIKTKSKQIRGFYIFFSITTRHLHMSVAI